MPQANATSSSDLRLAFLLKWMLEKSKTVVPEIKEGKVTYPEVTRLIPQTDPVELLDGLVARKILVRERHDLEVLCPSCGCNILKDQYTCPFCHGKYLATVETIHHLPCRHVDVEARFQKDGKLICDNCKRELKLLGIDYRTTGKVFKCEDCGRESGVPRIVHICQACGMSSTWEQTKLRMLHSYRIDEQRKNEITSLIGIHIPLIEFLRNNGFTVESPAVLKGQSGIEHSFDIVALYRESRILLDLVTAESEIDPSAVVSFFAKCLDVLHDRSVLIAVPKASDSAKMLCTSYNMSLVEGININEILKGLRALPVFASTGKSILRKTVTKANPPTTQTRVSTRPLTILVSYCIVLAIIGYVAYYVSYLSLYQVVVTGAITTLVMALLYRRARWELKRKRALELPDQKA